MIMRGGKRRDWGDQAAGVRGLPLSADSFAAHLEGTEADVVVIEKVAKRDRFYED
jgi:hypothetical protein